LGDDHAPAEAGQHRRPKESNDGAAQRPGDVQGDDAANETHIEARPRCDGGDGRGGPEQ